MMFGIEFAQERQQQGGLINAFKGDEFFDIAENQETKKVAEKCFVAMNAEKIFREFNIPGKILYIADRPENENGVMWYDNEEGKIILNVTGFRKLIATFGLGNESDADQSNSFLALLQHILVHEITHSQSLQRETPRKERAHDGIPVSSVTHSGFRADTATYTVRFPRDERGGITGFVFENESALSKGNLLNEGFTELFSWQYLPQESNDHIKVEILKEFNAFCLSYNGAYSKMARIIFHFLFKESGIGDETLRTLSELKRDYNDGIFLSDGLTRTTLARVFGPWLVAELLDLDSNNIDAFIKRHEIDLEEAGVHLHRFYRDAYLKV